MNYSKLTAIAALATSILAGSMTAAINDQNRLPQRGLDPMIIEILQRAEAGTLPEQFKPKTGKGLQPRILDRSKKPDVGIRRDDTRLQIKFADELQVRIKDDGTVISRTNRSISDITSIIEDFELVLTRTMTASEERVDAFISRAEHHSRKQVPDIGGIYWVDGTSSAVSAAASVFHGMDDVEWVFWNTIMDPTKHTSDRPSIFSELHQQEAAAEAIVMMEMLRDKQQPIQQQPNGACLLADRICEPNITIDVCAALAGTYLGDSSICQPHETERLVGFGLVGACCFSVIVRDGSGNPPMCLDTKLSGMTLANCNILTATSVFTDAYVAGTHSNGVWFEGEDCEGIETECQITIPTGPDGSASCGDDSDPATMFSGDCYHTQLAILDYTFFMGNPFGTPPAQWDNRRAGPGCYDSAGYPFFGSNPLALQGLCEGLIELVPECGVISWGDLCVSYALAVECNPNNLDLAQNQPGFMITAGGLSGDCASPWGNNHRPISYATGTEEFWGTQPMMTLDDGVPTPRGFGTIAYGCGWNNAQTAVPGLPMFTPTTATPDYGPELNGGMGLIQHLTDEVLADSGSPFASTTVASVFDPALLPWPMGGAMVGDLQSMQPGAPAGVPTSTVYTAVNNPVFPGAGLPVVPFFGDLGARISIWTGTGLNLFSDYTSPSGIGNGDEYSGLYGIGYKRQVETGELNGTHGAGVKVAVIDYAAWIQTYMVDTDDPPDGNVDTLVGGMHEDLSFDQDGVDAQGVSRPTAGVLLEGTATGHEEVLMLFNPPGQTDYPFDFPQSPNHGTAQLGVIAASWGAVPMVPGTVPGTGETPAMGTNFGAMGIAPEATTAFFPLLTLDTVGGGQTGGRVHAAWFNAMEWLGPGDILSAGYVTLDFGGTYPTIAFNPEVHLYIEIAVDAGITVVVNAGDQSNDLSVFTYPGGIDPGAISVCATTPGGRPAKRWVDSVGGSNFVAGAIDISRNTCSAWGMGVVTCGMGPGQDNWLGYNTITYTDPTNPVVVQSRSYTNNYGDTSAAAAIVAGCAASVQGYARQAYNTPLGPRMLRQYMAHGQILGNDPATGEPLLSSILSANTNTFIVGQGTEDGKSFTDWQVGKNGFDWATVEQGAGNSVGFFVDPRYACIRTTADSIFETPNVGSIQVIRGTHLEGILNSIATIDGNYFSVLSTHTTPGEYSVPANVPGGSVVYNFYGESTDTYITGIALDARGDPLLTLVRKTIDIKLKPTEAPITILQLWMWDFIESRWIQPSPTSILTLGSTDRAFEIVRAGSLLDDGRYHARLVSITATGPFGRLPINYDQIRIIPTIPGTTP